MLFLVSFFRNNTDWLTGNYILNVSVLAFCTAQLVKIIIYSLMNRKLDFSRLFESGGMPSSHAATVTALVATVGKVCGTGSPEFAIAAIVAMVVMYDALNIRRAAGEQAKRINFLMENWQHVNTPEAFERQLKELLGHTPFQVLIGALMGLAFGLLI
ncbi:MAG: divergent PAP2 family protein [Oscillospiraceae bacterium]|nr:divergent PAP2 family protein [Oscillospiraceae bacterium]